MIIRISENKINGEKSYWLWCPGCETAHRITDLWEFNGDIEKPTFSPSILVNGTPQSKPGRRCHSFIKSGQWEFLGDCDHKLAGQTVPMVDLPDWLANEK